MKLGAVFPTLEMGNDRAVIRDFAQMTEGAGYHHLVVWDHVLGIDPNRPGGFTAAHNANSPFHEPLVLFGFIAGVTERLEMVTGVLVLPQRETVLFAKQAAEADVLSGGGRLRFGVGIGWNEAEFDSMGFNFRNRARRIEEQFKLLRLLWSQPAVTFEGRYHRVMHAGINPRPVHGNIPLWLGGRVERGMERIGRIGDGWIAQSQDPAALGPQIALIHTAAREAGRDPSVIGIEARIGLAPGKVAETVELAHRFAEAGATHLSINTHRAGRYGIDRSGPDPSADLSPRQHIDAFRRFAEAYKLR
ncbi:MAG: LLM class F420-dependent oxidoreductase [Dehalococcoidia bacterium]|nr:LLM class F420-dependent oxidoreductase [Dehalococcoidia bacterium]